MVDITPRSAKHEKILREEWAQAQKEGIHIEGIQFDKLLAHEDD